MEKSLGKFAFVLITTPDSRTPLDTYAAAVRNGTLEQLMFVEQQGTPVGNMVCGGGVLVAEYDVLLATLSAKTWLTLAKALSECHCVYMGTYTSKNTECVCRGPRGCTIRRSVKQHNGTCSMLFCAKARNSFNHIHSTNHITHNPPLHKQVSLAAARAVQQGMLVRGFAGPIPTSSAIDALLQSGIQHIASDLTPGDGADGTALREALVQRGFVPECMARCNPAVLQGDALRACDAALKALCRSLVSV